MAAKIVSFSPFGSAPGCFAEFSSPRLTLMGFEIFFLAPNFDILSFSEDIVFKFTSRISCSSGKFFCCRIGLNLVLTA